MSTQHDCHIKPTKVREATSAINPERYKYFKKVAFPSRCVERKTVNYRGLAYAGVFIDWLLCAFFVFASIASSSLRWWLDMSDGGWWESWHWPWLVMACCGSWWLMVTAGVCWRLVASGGGRWRWGWLCMDGWGWWRVALAAGGWRGGRWLAGAGSGRRLPKWTVGGDG